MAPRSHRHIMPGYKAAGPAGIVARRRASLVIRRDCPLDRPADARQRDGPSEKRISFGASARRTDARLRRQTDRNGRFCGPFAVQIPTSSHEHKRTGSAFSRLFARVRCCSRLLRKSGRRVQVSFAKPFFAFLRSVCGPNPSGASSGYEWHGPGARARAPSTRRRAPNAGPGTRRGDAPAHGAPVRAAPAMNGFAPERARSNVLAEPRPRPGADIAPRNHE
jgi:hypothetical protein